MKTQHGPRKQQTEAGLATLDSTGLEFLILGASARRHRKNSEANDYHWVTLDSFLWPKMLKKELLSYGGVL